jgi:glyoxylase-like metal-dependent hydrolase (beta-lactamase superfamily II)
MAVEPIVTEMQVPAGMLGPEPVSIDTRCFLIAHTEGVILVDAGPPGTRQAIEIGLGRIGAAWSDVSDVVLTHSHFDHTGGLAEVVAYAPGAGVRVGAEELEEIQKVGVDATPLRDGDHVHDLEVLETPGHTPGHICLLDGANSVLLAGDAVGNDHGSLSLGPPAFTSDPDGARASLARIESMALERILFAHGPEVEDPSSAIRRLLRGSD